MFLIFLYIPIIVVFLNFSIFQKKIWKQKFFNQMYVAREI